MISKSETGTGRIRREKETIGVMMRMYCRDKHGTESGLCESCGRIYKYSLQRIDNCVFGNDKPACEVCPVHCFKRDIRDEIKVVMRYAGPRMMFRHPLMAIMHIYDKIIFKLNKPEVVRRKSKGARARKNSNVIPE